MLKEDLNEQIQSAYEKQILEPMLERRMGRGNPIRLKWNALKKRLKNWSAIKKRAKARPKKTKNAFDMNLWKRKTKTGGIKKMLKKMLKKIGIKEATQMEFDDLQYEDKIKALAQHLDIHPSEVEQPSYGGYEAEGGEYEVFTDSEADDYTEQYIEDSVWAFNLWFLKAHMDMEDVNTYFGFSSVYYDEDEDEEVDIDDEDEIFYMNMGMSFKEWLEEQQGKSEDANDTFLNLIKASGNWDNFVRDAINADGRGHFISSYDGEEHEEMVNGTWYYIYRMN